MHMFQPENKLHVILWQLKDLIFKGLIYASIIITEILFQKLLEYKKVANIIQIRINWMD